MNLLLKWPSKENQNNYSLENENYPKHNITNKNQNNLQGKNQNLNKELLPKKIENNPTKESDFNKSVYPILEN